MNPAFESDNHWNVPRLLPELQAEHLELPLVQWCRERRKSRVRSSWGFYVDDRKFDRLWSRPRDMLTSGAMMAIEPNFSVSSQTPRALALHATYKKRWLARFWQEHGIRILVDMNVAPEHADLNLLGVPQGWGAYATRGSVHRLDELQEELTLAKTRAGRDRILFVVYGGGRAVEDWCAKEGVIHIMEEREMVRRGQG